MQNWRIARAFAIHAHEIISCFGGRYIKKYAPYSPARPFSQRTHPKGYKEKYKDKACRLTCLIRIIRDLTLFRQHISTHNGTFTVITLLVLCKESLLLVGEGDICECQLFDVVRGHTGTV